MNLHSDLIDAMFARHGVSEPWEALPSTGLANWIFATRDVVLRVATDHRDGVSDARTESVAAPVAHAGGVLTPRLIAFDDTRTLVDRPFSLWERVHGETLGLTDLPKPQTSDVWRAVGRELARLHTRVRACPDPHGYLDAHVREQNLAATLKQLVDAQQVDHRAAHKIEQLIVELGPHVAEGVTTRFLHGDLHAMNVMCSTEGELLAIIDWGDAGWGDPAMDFGAIPLEMVPFALAGYEAEAPGALPGFPQARFVWDRLATIVEDLWDIPERSSEVDVLEQFIRESWDT